MGRLQWIQHKAKFYKTVQEWKPTGYTTSMATEEFIMECARILYYCFSIYFNFKIELGALQLHLPFSHLQSWWSAKLHLPNLPILAHTRFLLSFFWGHHHLYLIEGILKNANLETRIQRTKWWWKRKGKCGFAFQCHYIVWCQYKISWGLKWQTKCFSLT